MRENHGDMYARTIGLLRDSTPFCERKENLLRGGLGNGTFQVGRYVDGAVWAVDLSRISTRKRWMYAPCVYDRPS